MSFAVLHVQKATPNPIGLGMHINREYQPDNADPERKDQNRIIVDSGHNINEAIENRIKEGYTGKTAIRKDAVKALTYVLTGSHERMHELRDLDNLEAWTKANIEFLEQKHGKENIVSLVLHCDERTPHLHAVVVPLTADGRLSAKEILGDKHKMKQLQDDYAQKMKTFGLHRGREGSKAKHVDINEFYKDLREEMPKLKGELQELHKEVDDYTRLRALKDTASALVSRITKKDETKELKDQVQHLQEENTKLKTGLNNAALNLAMFEEATERLYQENQRLKSALAGQDQQHQNELVAVKSRATLDALSKINSFARKAFNLPGQFDIRGDTVRFLDDKGQTLGLSR